MKVWLLAILMCSYLIVLSQEDNYINSAETQALGNTNALNPHPSAIFTNPAIITKLENSTVSLVARNSYFLIGLNSLGASSVLNTKLGAFGLGIQYFGFEAYNQSKLRIGYARLLDPKFSLGIGLSAEQLNIQNYGSKTMINADIGLSYNLNEQLSLAATTNNIVRYKLEDQYKLSIAQWIRVGVQYQVKSYLQTMIQLDQELAGKLNAKMGIEYKFLSVKDQNLLAVRLGFESLNRQTSFGIGINLSPVEIGIASSWHPQLGVNNALGVTYIFKPKETLEP